MVTKKKTTTAPSVIQLLNAEVTKKVKQPLKDCDRKPARDPLFSSSSSSTLNTDSSLDEPLFGPDDPLFEELASQIVTKPSKKKPSPIFLDGSEDNEVSIVKIKPASKKGNKTQLDDLSSSSSSILIDLALDESDGQIDEGSATGTYSEDDTPEPEISSEDENDSNNAYSTSREYTDSREASMSSEEESSDFRSDQEFVEVRKLYSNKRYREEVSQSYSTSHEIESEGESMLEPILEDEDDDNFSSSSDLEAMAIDSDDELPFSTSYKPPGTSYKGQSKRLGKEFFTDLHKGKRGIEKDVVNGIKAIEEKRAEASRNKLQLSVEKKRLRYFDAFSDLFDFMQYVFLRCIRETHEENFSDLVREHLLTGEPLDYESLCPDPSFCVYDMTAEEQLNYSSNAKWVFEACSESAQSVERFFAQSSEELKTFIKSLFIPGELRFFKVKKSYDKSAHEFCKLTGKLLDKDTHKRAKLELRTSDPDKIRALYLDIHKDSQLLLCTIHNIFHLTERLIQTFSDQYMRIVSEKSFCRPRKAEISSDDIEAIRANIKKRIKSPLHPPHPLSSPSITQLLAGDAVEKQWNILSGEWKSLDQKHTRKSEYDRFMQLHDRTRFFNIDPIKNNS